MSGLLSVFTAVGQFIKSNLARSPNPNSGRTEPTDDDLSDRPPLFLEDFSYSTEQSFTEDESSGCRASYCFSRKRLQPGTSECTCSCFHRRLFRCKAFLVRARAVTIDVFTRLREKLRVFKTYCVVKGQRQFVLVRECCYCFYDVLSDCASVVCSLMHTTVNLVKRRISGSETIQNTEHPDLTEEEEEEYFYVEEPPPWYITLPESFIRYVKAAFARPRRRISAYLSRTFARARVAPVLSKMHRECQAAYATVTSAFE